MPQLRKDPFGPGWVIISPERGIAPSDFGTAKRFASKSPLSPGNEPLLGNEHQALRPLGSPVNAPDWQIRVIDSPSAVLEPKAFALTSSASGLFTQAASSGFQELVIEHPDARMTLEKMPLDHLVNVLKMYRERLSFLAQRPGIKHIQMTRNAGEIAGDQYHHPHAHLLALPVNNRWVEEELTVASDHFDKTGHCLFCDALQEELTTKERVLTSNKHFIAIAPYASKTPFEIWIFPRKHNSSFCSLAVNIMPDLADILKLVLHSMNSLLDHPPYNMVLHTLPNETNDRYHWHLELLPRLTRQAGFDWSTGFYVNPTPPEDAARFLKEALMMQGVGF